jgi:hypothetical protein
MASTAAEAFPPKEPRKPMGSGAKIGFAVAVVVLALAAGGYYFYQQRDHAPSAGLISARVEKDFANPMFKIAEITPTITPAGAGAADIQYKGVAELREPLYEKLESRTVLQEELKLDVDAWQTAQQTVAGKDAPRILELAGLKGIDDTLLQTTFLKEVSPKGLKLAFDGRMRATKPGSDWQLQPQAGGTPISTPPGQPRATFGSHTTVVGNSAEMDKLREIARAQADVPAKIAQGRTALVEERRANQEKMMAQLLADLAPGTLFSGTASTGTGTPEKLFLEITGVQEGEKQMTALLRNSGGWSDARMFQGTFAPDPENNALTITLATLRNQVVRKAGPFLERNESWQVVFSFSDGKLTGHSAEWTYDFTRLDQAAAAAAKTELAGEAGLLRAVTVPGKVFRGTVRGKSTTDSFEYLLRFNRQENDGAVLGATLEPPGHSAWQRSFHGAIIGSKIRAEGWPLRLETGSRDGVKTAAGNPLLGAREDFTVNLKLADGHLVGESKDFTWDFAAVADEEVAKLDADQGERKKEFFALVKTGASFTGRAHAADSDQTERVRVRFTLIDQRGGTAEAQVESLETSGVSREFRGPLDLFEGKLVLSANGRSRGRPGKAVHLPVFVDGSADAVISFTVDGEKLLGEVKGSGWKLEL